jgi:CheY-like chemotaxis protein
MIAPVLLVEDDPDTRSALCLLLESEGYTVVGAKDAQSALEQLEDGLRPSVVLVDLLLPDGSGWDVMKHLDQEAHLKSVPIILISGMPKDDVRILADAVFKKPVDYPNLLATIRQFANRQLPAAE